MTAGRRSVAVVGLGGMGGGMAVALLRAGFAVTVFNRTASKAAELEGAGARVVDSASAASAGAEVVLLSLADETAVTEVLLTELAPTLRPGQTVVDSSTVSPEFSRATTASLAAGGLTRLEACVVGNPQMAAEGALRVFVSGDEPAVDRVRDVLDAMGQQVRYLGEIGRASSLKLAFNLLLGVQTAGLAEAVTFAQAAGLSREMLLDALDGSGWRSPVLSFRAEFMRRRAYRPAGFRAALMHKDLCLAQREAAGHDLALPMVDCAAARFQQAISAGRADDDAAVIVDVPAAPG